MNKFNVIAYDVEFISYDVMPYLRECYKKTKKKPITFNEFKDFIKQESMYQFWSRCEYEIILTNWPTKNKSKKIDVYNQIMMNINVIAKLLMEDIT